MKKETPHNMEWESISKYLNGEMKEKERLEFETRMNLDQDLALAVEHSGKDLNWVDDLGKIHKDYNADLAWTKVKLRLSEKESTRKTFRLFQNDSGKRVLQIAAMLIFVIGLGFLSHKMYNNYLSPYQSFTSEVYESGNKMILPDGSEVTLNGEAKLVYPRKFSDEQRLVSLQGEAFFKISKNPHKPFVIQVDGAEIKVLGTSFNVVAKNSKVEVMVETGKVQFTGLENPENSLILTKGDFAVLSDHKMNKTEIKDDNYLSWKTHKMIFREMQLKEVARVIERTYQVQIDFEDSTIASKKINTTFDNDLLNNVLDNICLSFNLVYEKKGNRILIKKGI